MTRIRAEALQNYYDQIVVQKEFALPEREKRRLISSVLDGSVRRVYDAFQEQLAGHKPILKAIKTLRKGEAACGGFKEKNGILQGLTPYEQMTAVHGWVETTEIKKLHTRALLDTESRVIPIQVKPMGSAGATPMTTMIGSSRGVLHAPGYQEWANEDPQFGEQSHFIEPLNVLEIHRQPGCIAALCEKAAAYDGEVIDHAWRYKVYKNGDFANRASVELPKQKNKKTMEVKTQAAACNLAMMIRNPTLRKKNILPERYGQDYSDEDGMDCFAKTTPMQILKTFPEAAKGNTDPMDREMGKLLGVRVGLSNDPVVRKWTADLLFPINN
jgi:hypothetical protein